MVGRSGLIKESTSLIISCDVDFKQAYKIIRATYNIPRVGGYRITGSWAVWERQSLTGINENIINFSDKLAIIYDHQHAGLADPHYAKEFVEKCKAAKFSAINIATDGDASKLEEWVKAAIESGLKVIVEPFIPFVENYLMRTHMLCVIAYRMGVRDFKLKIDNELINYLDRGLHGDADFYFSGVSQKKDAITNIKGMLKKRGWHIIVGRAIYTAENPATAAADYARLLNVESVKSKSHSQNSRN